jgi:major membrane immunogen (membrane-anchored lipoprotein)
MRILNALLVAPLVLSACGSGNKPYIPPGTYAGTYAGDQPFTLDVGDKVHVNKLEGKFVKRGVVEVKDKDFHETLTCRVADRKGEELHCTARFTSDKLPKPVTEVIDLMLL